MHQHRYALNESSSRKKKVINRKSYHTHQLNIQHFAFVVCRKKKMKKVKRKIIWRRGIKTCIMRSLPEQTQHKKIDVKSSIFISTCFPFRIKKSERKKPSKTN